MATDAAGKRWGPTKKVKLAIRKGVEQVSDLPRHYLTGRSRKNKAIRLRWVMYWCDGGTLVYRKWRCGRRESGMGWTPVGARSSF